MLRGRELLGRVRVEGERRIGEVVGGVGRQLTTGTAGPGPRTLFVVAHARSGSTMLTHILGHHRDILSVGEHHVNYRGPRDLRRLRDRSAFMSRELRAQPAYVVDKIVHNTHMISDEVLFDLSTRYLFLLRRPEGTLPSVGKLFGQSDLDRQVRYYRRRLDGMVEVARTVSDPSRCAFVTYEQLTSQSEVVLDYLTSFLGLDSALSADYDVGATTGRQAWGDPSDRIRTGTIDRDRVQPDPLPNSISGPANLIFHAALRDLDSFSAPNSNLKAL